MLLQTGMIPYTSIKQFYEESKAKNSMIKEIQKLRQEVQDLSQPRTPKHVQIKSLKEEIYSFQEKNVGLNEKNIF